MQSPPTGVQDYRKLSFWLDSVPGSLEPRPGLGQDIEVDVAIAGAGYTGLWTAYYLKQLRPELSIAIVEAEIAGFGASGRNGGWCSAYLSGLEKAFEKPQQADAAIRLQRLLFETVREVGRVTERESIDCHYDPCGHVEAAILPAQLRKVRQHMDFLHGKGFSEEDFHWLTAEQITERVNIDGALGGVYASHVAAIHPARLVRGLADVVEGLGVKIYERTPVIELGQQELMTSGGRVKAGVTVLATEGYTGSIKRLRRKLIPVHSTMIASEPLNDQQLEQTGLQQRYCFNNLDNMVTYGQLTADRRIAFGCRGTYLYGAGIKGHFDPADPEFERVWETLLKFFPALKGGRFSHAWGGAMGVSRTLNPAVCFDSEKGLGWAGGYFGDGVGATNLAGRTLADLILERDTERVHTPWVNPKGARELGRKLWEIEPIRWLGIKSRARLMHMADRAEQKNSAAAPLIDKVLDTLFP